MSVSVSLVPFVLLFTVTKSVIVFSQIAKSANEYTNTVKDYNYNNIHLSDEAAQEFLNKTFETQIMDKDVLIKTLEEHGAVNIQEENGNISCNCEAFHLEFFKNEGKPYELKISCHERCNVEDFVDNIGNEYTNNAQEVSYNQIKERLEQQNLEIEEEEIYDDNTIVLTVNLE